MPRVCQLQIHPIKALDGVLVEQATLLDSGALEFDRRWAFVDAHDNFISGKNHELVHQIRAEYDLNQWEVALDGKAYSLVRQKPELEGWMSERLGEPVRLHENTEFGFPDDLESPGPTIVSTGSLELVCTWFQLSLAEARSRFRTNLEFDGVEAFWEDRLYTMPFQVGDVRFWAVNPCKRCVVPSRHPTTGEVRVGFQKTFAEKRRATLPALADPALFKNPYRFAVNTRADQTEGGKQIRLGDELGFPVS